MFGSGVLEVAIGLALVYLLLSLACTVINEWIAGLVGLRASNLEAGIRNLFKEGRLMEGKLLADAVYEHGLVQSLYRQDWLDKLLHRPGRPSYIPARVFATALLDILVPADANGSKSKDLVALRSVVGKLPASKARESLLALLGQVQGDISNARAMVEAWYDDAMDRVAGWYKRKCQIIVACLAVAVACISNTDSILVARTLWGNPALRASTVAAAQAYVGASPEPPRAGAQGLASSPSVQEQVTRVREINDRLQDLQLPLGWPGGEENGEHSRQFPSDGFHIFFRLLGWFVTAVALSLGAPFWFDLLNKFMVVRSTIKPK
jgi:hypothetical protein